jgi:hypothetical protein
MLLGPDLLERPLVTAAAVAAAPPATTCLVTPATRLAELTAALGADALGEPVAFNRAPNLNTTNPFGATLFYGYQDLIFEVLTQHSFFYFLFLPPFSMPVN